ncbi:nuclear transport factor 2 family protein [Brevibacterium atlanticum]|uniref:nuclear transport factor 2 family protein n=1 Tax=Brevibacterium atlanticum TaxID=2697563 RepID=UPI001420E5CE|nr:nuclear transport factor 2 family protein [Brevibacterium atlanticum]
MTEPQIPTTIATFIDIVNAHDEQGFLDSFAPEGVVDDWGREFVGRDAIKSWSDVEFIGATGTISPEEVTIEDDHITVIGDWASTHANGRSSFAFDLDGDQITRMTIREG